jgi:hypothetical protein
VSSPSSTRFNVFAVLSHRGAGDGARHAHRDREIADRGRSISPEWLGYDHPGGLPRKATINWVEMGWRKRPTPLEAFKKAWSKLDKKNRREAIRWLNEQTSLLEELNKIYRRKKSSSAQSDAARLL